MNPLKYFLIPLAAIAGIGFVLVQTYGSWWTWLLVVPIIAMGGVFGLAPQLKWWYWQRRAPDLETSAAVLLDQFALYQRLDLAGKRDFRRRTFLLRESTQYLGQAIEKIPPDAMILVAASAAAVSYGRRDFAFPEFDTVVLYNHDFPSPQREELHASELYVPDGTFLFNMITMMRSVFESRHFLQLPMYEFGRAYRIVYPGAKFPDLSWEQIAIISGFTRDKLIEFIGWPEPDRTAIGITLFLTHAESFARRFPETYAEFAAGLKQEALTVQ